MPTGRWPRRRRRRSSRTRARASARALRLYRVLPALRLLAEPVGVLRGAVVVRRRLEELELAARRGGRSAGEQRRDLVLAQWAEGARRLARLLEHGHAVAPGDHHRGAQVERVVQA